MELRNLNFRFVLLNLCCFDTAVFITDTSVKTVFCFDRAATGLFGCSADEFFHFTKLNPNAGKRIIDSVCYFFIH